VTFKELQRLVQSQSHANPEQVQAIQKLRRKEFWFWDRNKHKDQDRIYKGKCCFNHIIGLPTKDGIEKPLFEYEREIYWALLKPEYLNSRPRVEHSKTDIVLYPSKEKHIWIKKAYLD
jgi:hypothetical protein